MSTTSGIQQWEVKEPYLNLHCGLGEGPYYEKATNSLRFVDIKNKRLHTVDLTKGPESVTTLQFDVPVTVTADIEGVDPREKILIGAKYGIAVLDRKTGKYEYIANFEATQHKERLRSNDGAVDPHGRFWLGTMTDFGLGDVLPEGSLHLFAGGKATQNVRHPVSIPNSVSWSLDGKTMYFTHSTARTLYSFDYSEADDALTNERVFYVHDGPGEPDGHRIDAEGNLWTAVYGESCVLKVSPQGKLVGKIKLPTKNVTCVEFVGSELFITTAGMAEGEGTPEEVDLSGGLYRIDVGIKGTAPFEYRLGA
ncbi:uncharacterized protein BCR38DRAFT_405279 [Pseudomassariella vexata]|uniref:SMP-30/Gluconolactonase/LRE-like region domain-containing protein n=1 Tax=Pseudomassariella vexata TaxID=1141098 RepID=A0A1Y2EDC5_9PEZI|nr:uncharacterized protein BCR38DRAFT_405279 [Pseudomassariella vexata]ORY69571.1 hypothetical protein BCR38DRAFT_405279 [Pseudomassariella vexata]